jgi:oligosaccharide repeat unit polymerase
LIYIGIASGLLAVYLLISEAGIAVSDIFDLSKIKNVSASLSAERYNGIRLSPAIMLCLAIVYTTSFAAGAILSQDTPLRKKLPVILFILPVILFTLIYTSRAVSLFMFIIMAASFVAFKSRGKKLSELKLFNKTNVAIGLIVTVFLPLVFLITQAVRTKVDLSSPNQLGFLVEHLRMWFSGNLSSYSIWFDSQEKADQNFLYTFAGLSEWLGNHERALGIYDKQLDINHHMNFSNIYTLFRFLIDDFGLIGCCLVIFVLGYIAKKLFIGSMHGRLTDAAILSGILAMLLFSFITSLFAYNSILFAWIAFVFICFITERQYADK